MIFKILPLFILVFTGQASAQGCSLNDISCLSCSGYRICDVGYPGQYAFACNYGRECNAAELIQCWMKLKCYAPMGINECTGVGLFPNLFYDFRYYVCLSDPSGFIKYEFVCPEGQFFDKIRLVCAPRTADDSNDKLLTTAETYAPTVPATLYTPPETLLTTPPTALPTTAPSTTPTTPSTTPTTLSTTPTTPSTTPTTLSTTPTTPSTTPTTLSTTPTTPSTTPTTLSTTPTTPSTTPTTLSTTPTIPSTTPTTPSTTPTTLSTTPTIPSTTPTIPSTTPTTTPTPFVCVLPGIFPDPVNCKFYYRCSVSLKMFHYACPNSSYFNDVILKCSKIITPQCMKQISKNGTVVNHHKIWHHPKQLNMHWNTGPIL